MTISSPTRPARPDDRYARLNAYWQWWQGELRALVPARVMGWIVGEVAISDAMVDASGIRLMGVGPATGVAVTVPFADVSTHPALRELRAKGHDRVRVLLGADQVLVKSFVLPAAIEENLREVMGFELDRHTPFMASQAYYDVKLLKRDAQRDSIEVLLAVASRSAIDPLLAKLRLAGLSIDAITVMDAHPSGLVIELLAAADKPARKWGNLLKLNLALLSLVAVLGLLALLLPIWQKREQVIALNPLVGKANADFAVSQRIHDEYTKLAGEYNFITGKKQGMHPTLAILEELTKISPDTTSVQNLDLKMNGKVREVTLIGEAQAASKVIEVLEQSPLFQNASQRSQTRRGSLGTNEWFHIATELKPKVLPAAVKPGDATSLTAEKSPAAPTALPASSAGPVPPASDASPVTAETVVRVPTASVPTATVTVPAKVEPTGGAPVVPVSGKLAPPVAAVTPPPAAKTVPAEAAQPPVNRKQP